MNRFPVIVISLLLFLGLPAADTPQTADYLRSALSISSHAIMADVEELCREEYTGRLTGTEGYNLSAAWVVERLVAFGVQPARNESYYQDFPNPYTLVLDAGSLILHLPAGRGEFIDRPYVYEDEYIPGSTSASGRLTAEVVYVGYGVSAPELGYDDYRGIDVKGKIVLMEREVPVSPDGDPELFKRWRPYSFHGYKTENAYRRGAVGMLYNYHITNPNSPHIPGFQLSNVGERVVNDLFAGTGQKHDDVLAKITRTLRPSSMSLGKRVTMANRTEHHADGVGRNVIGLIPGNDPLLADEAIAFGGHLDHLGMNHLMMPGANDNASAVAVMLAVARAIHESGYKPRRSVLFLFFGAEEQGVVGSEYYLGHPVLPNDKIKAFFNMDGVGRGDSLYVLAGSDFPQLERLLNDVNGRWIHRPLKMSSFHNRARPRLDAAHFLWAGVPTVSFSAFGLPDPPYPVYHRSTDRPEILTPEIMEDLARLLFLSLIESDGVLTAGSNG